MPCKVFKLNKYHFPKFFDPAVGRRPSDGDGAGRGRQRGHCSGSTPGMDASCSMWHIQDSALWVIPFYLREWKDWQPLWLSQKATLHLKNTCCKVYKKIFWKREITSLLDHWFFFLHFLDCRIPTEHQWICEAWSRVICNCLHGNILIDIIT